MVIHDTPNVLAGKVVLFRLTLLQVIAVFACCAAASNVFASSDWRTVTSRDGITVYVNYDETTQLKNFRAVTQIMLADEYALVALYNDIESYPAWLHMITRTELVAERHAVDRDLRVTIALPWPAKDREVIVNTTLVQRVTPDDENVTVFINSIPFVGPIPNGVIRMPEMNGLMRIRRLAPELVEATFEISADPGGWLPSWLVNMVFRDVPYFSLQKLRRAVRKAEYQNTYVDYLDLFGPARPAGLPQPPSWIYGTALEN